MDDAQEAKQTLKSFEAKLAAAVKAVEAEELFPLDCGDLGVVMCARLGTDQWVELEADMIHFSVAVEGLAQEYIAACEEAKRLGQPKPKMTAEAIFEVWRTDKPDFTARALVAMSREPKLKMSMVPAIKVALGPQVLMGVLGEMLPVLLGDPGGFARRRAMFPDEPDEAGTGEAGMEGETSDARVSGEVEA